MKKLLAAIIILAATAPLGATAGCSEISGSCVTAINVENDSNTSSTYNVVIDGVQVGALTPGESETFEVTPGNHIVEIKNAAGGFACSTSFPAVAECTTFGLVCQG